MIRYSTPLILFLKSPKGTVSSLGVHKEGHHLGAPSFRTLVPKPTVSLFDLDSGGMLTSGQDVTCCFDFSIEK